MVKIKFLDFFEVNNFTFSTFFRILHCLTGNHCFLLVLITFSRLKQKLCVLPENGRHQICRFFYSEQFYFLTFFRISPSSARKWIF